jgi:hypothetical protein
MVCCCFADGAGGVGIVARVGEDVVIRLIACGRTTHGAAGENAVTEPSTKNRPGALMRIRRPTHVGSFTTI